jgi:hypothetical protein
MQNRNFLFKCPRWSKLSLTWLNGQEAHLLQGF